MKRVLLAAVLSALVSSVYAQGEASATDPLVHGDATAGATKATACFACHGSQGSGSVNPEWPKLAAQGAPYIVAQLEAFKGNKRKNPVMLGMAAPLSHEDMANVAAYFAKQTTVSAVASPDSVAIAQPLFRGGDASRGIPACAACHGPEGRGNAPAAFPRLAGQNVPYTVNQLKSYRSGERGADGKAKMMSTIASKLSDTEIQALASYVAGIQ
jgi:cytochrome c553